MTTQDRMTRAYLDAVAFTDFGEGDQPPSGAEFSPLAKAQAHTTCARFLYACADLIGENAEQAGHDLWLTRNGHGSGFWDRPEIWGEEIADTLSRCARCLGEKSIFLGDDGFVYFD